MNGCEKVENVLKNTAYAIVFNYWGPCDGEKSKHHLLPEEQIYKRLLKFSPTLLNMYSKMKYDSCWKNQF